MGALFLTKCRSVLIVASHGKRRDTDFNTRNRTQGFPASFRSGTGGNHIVDKKYVFVFEQGGVVDVEDILHVLETLHPVLASLTVGVLCSHEVVAYYGMMRYLCNSFTY